MSSVSRSTTFFTPTDTATPSFLAQAIGANHGNDSIYIAVVARNTTNPAHASTTLTVDGVAATLCGSHSVWNGGSGNAEALFSIARNLLPDPAQTDVDIVVTWAATVLRTGGYLWVSPDSSPVVGAFISDGDAGSSINSDVSQSMNVNTSLSGIVLGFMFCGNASAPDVTMSFTGLTADAPTDTPGENIRMRSASADHVSAETPRSVSCLFDFGVVNLADPISFSACFPQAAVVDDIRANAIHTDGTRMLLTAQHLGPGQIGLRVKVPTAPEAVPQRLILLLSVKPADTGIAEFGDGYTEFLLNGWPDEFNTVVVGVETPVGVEPWLGDHPTDMHKRYESYIVTLIPWLFANIPGLNGSANIGVGSFSKGGVSAAIAMLRHPDLIECIFCFDGPVKKASIVADLAANTLDFDDVPYGTEANYDTEYDILANLTALIADGDYNRSRFWLSGWETEFSGNPVPYHQDMLELHDALVLLGVPHVWEAGGTSEHRWDGDTTFGQPEYWLTLAVAGLIASFEEFESVDITVDDSSQAQAATSPTITEEHVVVPSNTLQTQAATEPALTQAHVIEPAAALHTQTATSPALTQEHVLSPNSGQHTQAATSPALTQLHFISPAASLSLQAATSPLVTEDTPPGPVVGAPSYCLCLQLNSQYHLEPILSPTHQIILELPICKSC